MDKKEVAQLLGKIDIYYPGKIKDENKVEMLNAWSSVLKTCKTEKVYENLEHHIKSSPFLPTISDLGKDAGIFGKPKTFEYDINAGEDW